MIDRRGWRRIGAGLACVPALAVLAAVNPTRALADASVDCDPSDLITAINTANASSGGTLDLVSGCTYTYTTADNTTDLPGTATPVITSPITINGNGDTITRSASAVTAFRLFDVGSAGMLTLNNTIVTNGSALGNGGGILDQANLTLSGDTITGNNGSGINQLLAAAGITATNTTFSNNTQNGVFNQGPGLDTLVGVTATNNTNAGVLSNGAVNVSGSTISGNHWGVQTVNSSSAANTITVTNSTLASNTTDQVLSSGAATVTGTTISGASANDIVAAGDITMTSDTVSGWVTEGINTTGLTPTVSLTDVTLLASGSSGTPVDVAHGQTTVTDSQISKTGATGGVAFLVHDLTLTRSLVSNYSEGVIATGGVTLASSTLTSSPGSDGIIASTASSVTDSTISGFGFGFGVEFLGSGANTVTGSVITNNDVGIGNRGPGTVDVSRSTVALNRIGVSLATSVTASTIAGNTGFGVDGPTTVADSILSSNGANCLGTVTDGGDNVNFPASDASCPAGFEQGDPKLDSLRDNGGPTQTMALLDGSVAEGSTPVGATGCTGSDTDQRGVPRLQNNEPCDAGAFELDSTSTVVTPSATSLTDGQTLSLAGVVTPFSAIPGNPSGTLSFFNGSTLIATVTLTNGQAADGPLTLPVGTYTVVASFPGARGFLASTSAAVTVVVSPPVPSVGAAEQLPPPVAPALLILGGLGLIDAVRRPRRR